MAKNHAVNFQDYQNVRLQKYLVIKFLGYQIVKLPNGQLSNCWVTKI